MLIAKKINKLHSENFALIHTIWAKLCQYYKTLWTYNVLGFFKPGNFGSAIAHLPWCFCPWTFLHFQNIIWFEPVIIVVLLVKIFILNLDILQGCSGICNWLSLRYLVPWINHLPSVCWSIFSRGTRSRELWFLPSPVTGITSERLAFHTAITEIKVRLYAVCAAQHVILQPIRAYIEVPGFHMKSWMEQIYLGFLWRSYW